MKQINKQKIMKEIIHTKDIDKLAECSKLMYLIMEENIIDSIAPVAYVLKIRYANMAGINPDDESVNVKDNDMGFSELIEKFKNAAFLSDDKSALELFHIYDEIAQHGCKLRFDE